MSTCVGQAFVRLINEMKKGDPSIGMAVLDPTYIKDWVIIKNAGNVLNWNMTCANVKITKICENVELKSAHFDLDKLELNMTVWRPEVDFSSPYQMKGKVLWLPIWGSGAMSMKMINVLEDFYLKGKRVERDGKTYWEVTEHLATLRPGLIRSNFDNLFNGNAILGNAANRLMNAQWKLIYGQLHEISDAKFSEIMTPEFHDILMHQSLEEMFPAA